MRMSTFCILLASALMLMGALIGGLMKANRNETEEKALSVSGQEMEAAALVALSGRAERFFGAEYSEELNQWTQNLWATVEAEKGTEIRAMTDCTVVSAKEAEGGSRLELTDGETTIILQPVTKLRVFEESRLEKGDIIGETEGMVEMSAKAAGEFIDPLASAVIIRQEKNERVFAESRQESGGAVSK